MTNPADVLNHLAEQERRRILSMEAGAALDAKIARVVFGHKPFDIAGQPGFFLRQEEGYPVVAVPPYSTDSGAAWLVVSEMQRRGYSYAVWSVCPFSSVQPTPIAAFTRSVYPPCGHDAHGGVAAEGDSPASAIARAALMAMLNVTDARP